MKVYVSRLTVLLIMFVGLLISKFLNVNSIIDDLLLLVAGAILGKEALNSIKQKKE